MTRTAVDYLMTIAHYMTRGDHEKATTLESKARGDQTSTFWWLWLCAVCLFLSNYGDPAVIVIPAEDWFSYGRHDFFHVRTEGWDLAANKHMRTANGKEQEMGSHGGLAGPDEDRGHHIAVVCRGYGDLFVGNGCFKTATCLVDGGCRGHADADTTVNSSTNHNADGDESRSGDGFENGRNEVNGGANGSNSGGGNGGGGGVGGESNGNGYDGGDEGNGNGDRDGGGSEVGEEEEVDDVEEEAEDETEDDNNAAAVASLDERIRSISLLSSEIGRFIAERRRVQDLLNEISRSMHLLNDDQVRRLIADQLGMIELMEEFIRSMNNLNI